MAGLLPQVEPPEATPPCGTVLLVEDDPLSAALMQRVLATLPGVRVREVHDLASARGVLATTPLRFVVLDQHLPDGQGGSLLPLIGGSANVTPIVIVTADGRPETRGALLAAGAWDVVTKPFDVAELRAKLGTLFDAACRAWLAGERSRRFTTHAGQVLERIAERFGAEPAGHASRVGELAGALALWLGWPPAEAHLLQVAAGLHDLGKLGVPGGVLAKPGPLTQEERWKVERHALMGAELFADVPEPLFALAFELAATHHERWDGGGYPLGLAGEEIPPSGRIVAVADVYDALISRRVYKEAVSPAEALATIRAERGRAFDPAVVDALGNAWRASGVQLPGGSPRLPPTLPG